MSNPVRITLAAGLLAAAMAAAFPPWVHTAWVGSGQTVEVEPAGFAFVRNPPRVQYRGIRIDGRRLVVMWAVIGLATGAGVMLVSCAQKKGAADIISA